MGDMVHATTIPTGLATKPARHCEVSDERRGHGSQNEGNEQLEVQHDREAKQDRLIDVEEGRGNGQFAHGLILFAFGQ